VFFEKATYKKNVGNNLNEIFMVTLKKLILISFPLFFILFFVVEDIFAFIFGEKWRIAGVYAQIMIPVFLSRFIVSTFTLIPIIYKQVRLDLFFQVGMLFFSVIIIYWSYMNKIEFINYLLCYSIGISIYYLLYLGYIYKYFIKVGKL
jgi:O-antigen/teichoic acid export membrane protein